MGIVILDNLTNEFMGNVILSSINAIHIVYKNNREEIINNAS